MTSANKDLNKSKNYITICHQTLESKNDLFVRFINEIISTGTNILQAFWVV